MGTQNENPTPTTQSPEVVQGGLTDGAVANPAPAQSASAEPAKPKKYILHGREFESVDAALAYAEGMTAQVNQPAQQTVTPTTTVTTAKKPSDILFENPDEAIALLKQELKQEIRAEDNQKTSAQKAWDKFFNDNQDLKGFEEEVELQRQKHFAVIKTLPESKAAELLATETRARLAKIRGSANTGEQVTSKAATVAASSGPTTPAPTTTVSQSQNFIEEFKSMQRKRSKKIS